MGKKTRVLQVGSKNWWNEYRDQFSNELDWTYLELTSQDGTAREDWIHSVEHQSFEVVVCSDRWDAEVMGSLSPSIEAYGLIVDQSLQIEVPDRFQREKQPFFMSFEDHQRVIQTICSYFFSGQFGDKLHTQSILVSESFDGEVTLSGESFLKLKGDFSNTASLPLLYWQNLIWLFHRSKKLWLEFSHEPGVEISLQIVKIIEYSSEVAEVVEYSESELKKGIEVTYERDIGYLSLSLFVKGKGMLYIGPLHFRDDRKEYGEFFLGGQKIIDDQNQELFYYFHPGDLKPPLNVYFSGWRSAEGFEGFYMMKELGAPFLLITDPRLEGGAFYMGSPQLEQNLIDMIRKTLKRLGFTGQQLILSGLSMGTFGALYYASDFEPSSVILGKPLTNVGDIAKNGQTIRPREFGTAIDILKFLMGGESSQHIRQLNNRFWDKFDRGKFLRTNFIVAYMKNDDYDVNAYRDLIEHLMDRESVVVGKGIEGRHNDNNEALTQWFKGQYRRILSEKFNRGRTDNEI